MIAPTNPLAVRRLFLSPCRSRRTRSILLACVDDVSASPTALRFSLLPAINCFVVLLRFHTPQQQVHVSFWRKSARTCSVCAFVACSLELRPCLLQPASIFAALRLLFQCRWSWFQSISPPGASVSCPSVLNVTTYLLQSTADCRTEISTVASCEADASEIVDCGAEVSPVGIET